MVKGAQTQRPTQDRWTRAQTEDRVIHTLMIGDWFRRATLNDDS